MQTFFLRLICFLTCDKHQFGLQNDVQLIHEIEAVVGKQLENFECKENEVLENITKVSTECFLGSTSFISQVEFMVYYFVTLHDNIYFLGNHSRRTVFLVFWG